MYLLNIVQLYQKYIKHMFFYCASELHRMFDMNTTNLFSFITNVELISAIHNL